MAQNNIDAWKHAIDLFEKDIERRLKTGDIDRDYTVMFVKNEGDHFKVTAWLTSGDPAKDIVGASRESVNFYIKGESVYNENEWYSNRPKQNEAENTTR